MTRTLALQETPLVAPLIFSYLEELVLSWRTMESGKPGSKTECPRLNRWASCDGVIRFSYEQSRWIISRHSEKTRAFFPTGLIAATGSLRSHRGRLRIPSNPTKASLTALACNSLDSFSVRQTFAEVMRVTNLDAILYSAAKEHYDKVSIGRSRRVVRRLVDTTTRCFPPCVSRQAGVRCR